MALAAAPRVLGAGAVGQRLSLSSWRTDRRLQLSSLKRQSLFCKERCRLAGFKNSFPDVRCFAALRKNTGGNSTDDSGSAKGKSRRESSRGQAAAGEISNGGAWADEASGDEQDTGEGRPEDARIVQYELHREASESYLAYAMAVIVGRALPDVRDGLKPVHRRILFAMHELGLSSKKPFRKCARVVGEVLGKFHPHGDTAVYDALVRMAQSFSLRSPLINGHGNFGSVDADPPAAMRYTECRLQALSESMLLTDLEADTVNFIPNFDNSQMEPVVLPARLPNVLLNGASGIAVGMATNIPPHNLGEVVDALLSLIENPNATVEELMEHMPGPDFPTGGQILGTSGLLEVYRTGRGGLTVRGRAEVEELDKRGSRSAIIISEVPYKTNKAALVEKIADLVNDKTLEGVSDIRDESDRDGMRIVIELKRGAEPGVVLNNIYKHTTLQSRFSCNMVGIVNGEPMTLGLKDFLEHFLQFRIEVIERRAKYHLHRCQEREHTVKGILIGLENLDRVVTIIRGAKDTHAALAGLQQELGVSHVQADALLGMPLRRLTSLERNKLLDEEKELATQIAELQQLLQSKQRVLQVIEKEALALKKEYGTPRLTSIEQGGDGEINDVDVIANVETLVTLSERGYVKRMAPDTFTAQNRGTVGKSGGRLRDDDALSRFFACKTHDYVLFFSERGVVYSIRAYQIPECSRTSAGNPLVQILPLPPGERITSVMSVDEFAEDQYLVMLTTAGYIKRTALSFFSAIRPTGIVAIQLIPGDELRWVRRAVEEDEVVISSEGGMLVRVCCGNDKLRARGRATRGVRAMKLRPGDKLAALDIVPASLLKAGEGTKKSKGEEPCLLFVSKNGFGKRVPIQAFTTGGLGRMGVIGCKLKKGDSVASLYVSGVLGADGQTEEEVVVGSHQGILNRLRVRDISVQSRTAKGVRIMRLEEGDEVKSVSLLTGHDVVVEESKVPAIEAVTV
ncbi:hypothetical protein R1sor_012750 [Riccia sorocarpa]|uniref:DNA gyrase subunit A, chloroplastic/mitochondrial n=1 Tax=Riccia sorocarpa TaxID=122646 RepID=A0ABD3IAV4_9MARC